MDSSFRRLRLFFYGLPLLLVIIMGTVAGAQGFSPFAPVGGVGLSMYVGYASDGGTTKFQYNYRPFGVQTAGLLTYDPVNAFYLGAAVPIPLPRLGALRVAGSWTAPASAKVDNLIDTTAHGASDPYRAWTGRTMWGTLEGLLEYPLGTGFMVLGGFRWDNWQTSLTNPQDTSVHYGPPAPTNTASLTVNSYVPLIGLKTSLPGFTFGAVGFPIIGGNIQFNYDDPADIVINEVMTYSKGYLMELFTEYGLPAGSVMDGLDGWLSIFAKYNLTEATGSFTLTQLTTGAERPAEFSFRRQLFIVGGKATLSFNLPSL